MILGCFLGVLAAIPGILLGTTLAVFGGSVLMFAAGVMGLSFGICLHLTK